MKCLISIVSIMFLMSCSSDSVTNTVNLAPVLDRITSSNRAVIFSNTETTLIAFANDPDQDDLTYLWSSQGGQFSEQIDSYGQSSITWTAPQEIGIYNILCTVSDGQVSDISVFTIQVTSIPSLVFVESGAFDMGDNFNEGDADERPVHTVFLDAYSIGKYEVTNEQFAGFLNDTINDIEFGTTWYDISDDDAKIRLENGKFVPVFGFEDHPVAWVTWFGARAYGRWLTKKTGDTYRLPTEAEWEKAARGDDQLNQALGHQRRYPWGDSLSVDLGSYGNRGNPFDTEDFSLMETSPVGYYDGTIRNGFQTNDNSSPYGAFDMSSNVSEWCLERYFDGYYAESPSSNPMGVLFGIRMVERGGNGRSSRAFSPVDGRLFDRMRGADRDFAVENWAISEIGFRVVRTN